jgi:hypothetical protein
MQYSYFELLKGIFKKIQSYFILFVGLAVVVFGYSFYRYNSAVITYKSELYAISRTLSNEQALATFGTLKKAIEERNYDFLKGGLGLSKEQIDMVKKLEANIIMENMSEELLKMRDYRCFFSLEAVVSDHAVLEDLEKGIVAYMNQMPYIKSRIDSYKKSLIENIVITENSAKDVDSLATNFKRLLSTQKPGQLILENPGTLSDINVKSFELRMKRSKLETELAVAEDFQVIQSFVPSYQKFSPNQFKYIVLSTSIFGISFVLLVLFAELAKALLKLKTK